MIVKMTEQSENKINIKRVFSFICFGIIGGLIIYIRFDNMFYLKANIDTYNPDRFGWCLASSCFGFSFLASQFIRNEKSPLPLYITHYPFKLIVISALVFSACHLFEASSGFVFYYLSFALCFILSYLVDYFWILIFDFIKRLLNKMEKMV